MTYRRRVNLTRLLLLAAILILIEATPRVGLVSPLTLVPLTEMIDALRSQFVSGSIWPHLRYTGGEIFASVALASVCGVAIGYGLWKMPGLRRALEPYLTSYYALPVFAFYPVLVGIFGLNRIPVIALAWAYAVVAVIVNTVIGFDSVKSVHMRVAQVYGLSRWKTFTSVQLRSAAPFIISGFKLGATYAVTGVIGSEFILSTQGLGWLVAFNYNSFATAQMYASILLIILLSASILSVLSLVERRWWHGGRRTA